jgi:hypothetical protein
MLSLLCVIPSMPMVAALSVAHLGAILFPAALSRLHIVCDDDPAGDGAMNRLMDRARMAAIEALVLSPQRGDFNEDLRNFDINTPRAALRVQLSPEDVDRCLSTSVGIGTEEPPLTAFFRGRPCGKRSGDAMAGVDYFPSRRQAHPIAKSVTGPRGRRFTSRGKIVVSRHPPLCFGRFAALSRCGPGPPAAFRRHEGRDERGRSDKGETP